MKKFYFLLSLVIAALSANAATVTDVLDGKSFPGINTAFKDITATAESGNYYKGKGRVSSAADSTLLFSGNEGTGGGLVVSEIKEGTLRKVTVNWNSGRTDDGFVMEVYGSEYSFAYSAMFNNSVELIGNITKEGDTNSFEVPAQYKYVGVRPAGDFAFVKSLEFAYEVSSAVTTPTFTLNYNEDGGEVRVINTKTGEKLANGQAYEIELGTSLSCFASANVDYEIGEYAVNGVAVAEATGLGYYLGEIVFNETTELNVTFKAKETAPKNATVTVVAGDNIRRYTVYDYDDASSSYLILSEPNTSKSAEYPVGDRVYAKVFANEGEGYVISKLTINGEERADAVGKEDYGFIFTLEGDTEIYAEGKLPGTDPEPAEYTINYTLEGDGTLSIFDPKFTILSNGAKVEAGTVLTLAAIATDGNIIEEFSINGETATNAAGENGLGLQRFNLNYTAESDLDIKVVFKSEEEPAPTDYCNNYEGMSSSHSERYLGTVTFTSGDETLTVTAQGKLRAEIYQDKTDEVFEITPGSSINIKCTGGGVWMHGYAWVDWNRDYVFTPDFDGNAVTANSELVAFNYYNGYDSNGVAAPNNSNGYQADLTFNVPEDITYGDYRFRYIIAWDNINPCGPELSDKDELRSTGGCILDVTLRYSEPIKDALEAIEAAEEVAPVYYNLQGVRVANPANGVFIKVAGNKAEKVYLNK